MKLCCQIEVNSDQFISILIKNVKELMKFEYHKVFLNLFINLVKKCGKRKFLSFNQ
jgi:hypothetical protein